MFLCMGATEQQDSYGAAPQYDMMQRIGMSNQTFVILLGLAFTLFGGLMIAGTQSGFFNTFVSQTNSFQDLLDNVTQSEGVSADLVRARNNLGTAVEMLHLGRMDQANESLKDARRAFNDSVNGLENLENMDQDELEEYFDVEDCFLEDFNPFCDTTDLSDMVGDMKTLTMDFREGTSTMIQALHQYHVERDHAESKELARESREIFEFEDVSVTGLGTDADMIFNILFINEPTFVRVNGAPVQYSIENYATGASIYPMIRAAEIGMEATSMHTHHLIDHYLRSADRRANELLLKVNSDSASHLDKIVGNYTDFMDKADDWASNYDDNVEERFQTKKSIDENILRATNTHATILDNAYSNVDSVSPDSIKDDLRDAIEDAGCHANDIHQSAESRINDRDQATDLAQGGVEGTFSFDCP